MDGYNIIFAWDALKKLAAQDVAAAREALAGILANYRGWRRCEIILVFDAYKVKGNPGSMEKKNGITSSTPRRRRPPTATSSARPTTSAKTTASASPRRTNGAGHHPRSRRAAHLRPRVRGGDCRGRGADQRPHRALERADFDLRRVRATATIIDKKGREERVLRPFLFFPLTNTR